MAAITFDTAYPTAERPEAGPPAALDAGIVSDAIPAFFIGRNKDGFWVARDTKGRIGGLFLLKNSAVTFARTQAGPGGCATIFPTERFELDLENDGNGLIGFFRATNAHRATIKRIGIVAGFILLALSTVGAIIALKTAIFLSRLSY
jgi:hypothetical protein